MGRKYKIFVKDKSVIFSENAPLKNINIDLNIREKDEQILNDWVIKLEQLHLESSAEIGIDHLDGFIIRLLAKFPLIMAGGGFVLNEQNHLLMIHRRGFWDLPKGKLDEGETIQECALREVNEECGIVNHRIVSEPFHTYHMYKDYDGRAVIKDSVWFVMKADGIQRLKPQTEEDIEQVIWQNLPVSKDKMEGAYASIRDVITNFQSQLL